MVCIDGEFQGVTVRRLDNELSRSFFSNDGQPSAGSTVTLQSYTVMRMKPHEGTKHSYVTEFDWKPSPREERSLATARTVNSITLRQWWDQELTL
jgi:hypothetical protein